MENTSILIVLFALIVVGIIVFFLYKYFIHSDKKENNNCNKNISNVESDIDEEILPSLVPIIKYFKGQCNSFRMLSDKPVSANYREDVFNYADKVMEYHASDELKKWWKIFINDRNQWDEMFYKEKAKQIVMMIREAGVTPSTEKVIEWNENAELHYVPYDDITDGDICDVIHPCWIYKNEIFEQGLVSKKTNKF